MFGTPPNNRMSPDLHTNIRSHPEMRPLPGFPRACRLFERKEKHDPRIGNTLSATACIAYSIATARAQCKGP